MSLFVYGNGGQLAQLGNPDQGAELLFVSSFSVRLFYEFVCLWQRRGISATGKSWSGTSSADGKQIRNVGGGEGPSPWHRAPHNCETMEGQTGWKAEEPIYRSTIGSAGNEGSINGPSSMKGPDRERTVRVPIDIGRPQKYLHWNSPHRYWRATTSIYTERP